MNKIVAISMVKNEADIIESFVRHTLSFADELFIVDHCSTDATCKILELLQGEGLPLQIETFRNPAHLQAEVMNDLMNRAIKDYDADIIVPLDADEFILPVDAGMSVKAILQGLPANQVFEIPWLNLIPTDFSAKPDTFLLNRVCSQRRKAEGVPKCLVGRKAVLDHQLSLAQGNHSLLAEGKIYNGETITSIYMAHFNWRSKTQMLSKVISGWLTNVAKYSKWTVAAFHWRRRFQDYCDNGEEAFNLNDKNDYIKVGPLVEEKINIRYSNLIKMEPMQNVLLTAENIAHKLAVVSTAEKIGRISVMLIMSDNEAAVRASLISVLEQTFPRTELLLLDTTGDYSLLGKKLQEEYSGRLPIYYLSMSEYGEDLLIAAGEKCCGEYIQWLQAGDVLAPDKLLAMAVASYHSVGNVEACYCDNGGELSDEFMETSITWQRGKVYTEIAGAGLFLALKQNLVPLSGRLGGFLFRRDMMKRLSWLNGAFVRGRLMLFTAFRMIFSSDYNIGAVEEKLISCRTDFLEDYIWYQIEEWLYFEEEHTNGRLGDADYIQIAEVQRNIAGELACVEKNVPVELYDEYLKIVGLK